MEKQPFEDVSPIKHGGFFLVNYYFLFWELFCLFLFAFAFAFTFAFAFVAFAPIKQDYFPLPC